MMRWHQTEYILKGVFLGLLLLVALRDPSWLALAQIGLITLGGLVLCLGVAAVRNLREGLRVRGRLLSYLLFLLLENPVLVYTGVIVGLMLGSYYTLFKGLGWGTPPSSEADWQVWAPVAGGAALGYVFWLLRHVRDRRQRLWLSLALAVALVAGAISAYHAGYFNDEQQFKIGVLLLLGIPLFYLLTFASLVEETEIEIGAMCAALGVAFFFLGNYLSPTSPYGPSFALAIPLALYFVYTRKVLPGLRVFKHVLRGLSYSRMGQVRPALFCLGRALQLDPNNNLAREQLWRIYRLLDLDQLKEDPETLAVVNYELCLERASWLLLQDPPRPDQIEEAQRLLRLIASQRPALEPACAYWRAVAFLHQRNYDDAGRELHTLLADSANDTPQRRAVLLPAWHLVLVLHPEMSRRVGTALLVEPARRLEAIAAVERRLNLKADDQTAWDLKRLLYSDLREADYDQAVGPDSAAADFDHAYVQQLGLALLEDKARWQRGCEYLRLAARGLTAQAPNLLLQIGKAHERAGDTEGLWSYYQRAKQAGRAIGPSNLSEADRQALFAAVKQLGDHARERGDLDTALDSYHFFTLNERAGLETYRILAELYERKAELLKNEGATENGKDAVWVALHCTEHALSYDSQDKDLLERKDRYYYSITPEEVRARRENVFKWFDVDYCLQKTRMVLERHSSDLDMLDWGSHLAELVQAIQPSSFSAKVLRARIKRVRGEVDQAMTLLEEVRTAKPEKFPSGDEEEAWYMACRILGEMYVEEKPDQAVLCLLEYRKSPKSGANTLYNLGRAYENLGDHVRAARAYENVLAFEGNPLTYEAREALDRLRLKGSTDIVS